jgi:hypothetical protein
MIAAGPFPRRSLPLGGLSPDIGSPVDCRCLVKSRALARGAACEAGAQRREQTS